MINYNIYWLVTNCYLYKIYSFSEKDNYVNEIHCTKNLIITFISFLCSVEQKIWINENRINISILIWCEIWVIYMYMYIVNDNQLSLAISGVYT